MSKQRTRQPRDNSAQPRHLPMREQGTFNQVAVQESEWYGPIPSPDQLARFETIIPGSAERILKMAEQEGDHAREIQKKAVIADIRLEYLGQAYALVFSVGMVAATYSLAMAGHDIVAGILGGTTLITIALAFLGHKKPKRPAH